MDIGETERIWEVEPIAEWVDTPATQPAMDKAGAVSITGPREKVHEKKGNWE